MMRKETRLRKTLNNAIENNIKRFSKLKANGRDALLEEIGVWVFFDYAEIEIDYLNHKQYGGKK
tara:strand:- start:306 stop:497 length:192 start_codon:yes stop_codon:yes gene_type:complete